MIAVKLGSLEFTGVFDTGQYGGLWITQEQQDQLIREGALVRDADGKSFTLSKVEVGDGNSVTIPHIEINHGTFPPSRKMGIEGKNGMTFGYGLLSQFNTVWDFQNQRMSLLKR
jgi:hypothetical protein